MDMEVFRGRTYDMTFRYEDDNGNPVDLTGCTVYFTVKPDTYDDSATDATAPLKKTISIHSNPTAGETGWELNDKDTWLEPDTYNYDVIVERPDGRADPPSLYGRFKVIGTPTNRNVGNE